MRLSTLTEDARIAAASAADYAQGLVRPAVRLGVTGLSRSGKTVFITALVHNLLHGGRLPQFRALAEGRILRTYLAPQPDQAVPRFDYESHVAALTGEARRWPDSTRSISELRLMIEFEPMSMLSRMVGRGRIAIDIVDYPGEWLLDLPLLSQSYAEWSREAVALSHKPPRAAIAQDWHGHLSSLDPMAEHAEEQAIAAARTFTDYLRACRDSKVALSTVPPGRFLMPGDLEGSPALTFAPLILPEDGRKPSGSLWALMEQRYEAYKSVVVRPFFRDHFVRLDRQIVLVDALAALNAGADAVQDLEHALADILTAFRPGRRNLLSSVFRPRIDRILFAATKADHLHQTGHDRLEAIAERLTERARQRAEYAGAAIGTIALASVRATREAHTSVGGKRLACITGTPEEGERLGDTVFDGEERAAVFPGALPDDPEAALAEGAVGAGTVRFVRFRPPLTEPGPAGKPVLPHIRLDRALDFLIGDHLT